MIDRVPNLNKAGQGIDFEGPAKRLAVKMGILAAIQSKNTGEEGFAGIRSDNTRYATFPGGGMTNENEIMRGDLCEVLVEAAREMRDVEMGFERVVRELTQSEKEVSVLIERKDNGVKYTQSFDAIIAADGVRSKTRDLILDAQDTKDCLRPLSIFIAFFSIPLAPQDGPYSRWQHAVKGRSLIIRPLSDKFPSIYLMSQGKSNPTLCESLKTRDLGEKRRPWAKAFEDCQYGEFPRILRQMLETDKFYSDELVGKTPLAFVSAYILAGDLATEIVNGSGNIPAALTRYEQKACPFVDTRQAVPLWGNTPFLLSPQSAWAIWAQQKFIRAFSWSVVSKHLPDLGEDAFYELPEYEVFGKEFEINDPRLEERG